VCIAVLDAELVVIDELLKGLEATVRPYWPVWRDAPQQRRLEVAAIAGIQTLGVRIWAQSEARRQMAGPRRPCRPLAADS